ncbi:MAG: DUF4870 domain-containing protein [Anaerolineales bacterium]
MNHPPSTEERIWSVLAHLSALLLGMGILLPIIGWAEQRRKSKFVVYQCLQALGYQTLGYTIWILGYLLVVAVLLILMMIVAMIGSKSEDVFAVSVVAFNSIFLIFVFASLGIYLLFPLIAAVACGMGKDFQYPFMGKRLANYLEYNAENDNRLNEDHEDRWVAAAGHFSVIIAFWGMLAPVTAWILQGARSAWLKFQSAQAVVFHVCVLALGFVAGALYLVGMVAFIALTGFSGDTVSSPANGLIDIILISGPRIIGLIGIIVMFGSMIVALLILLVIPLFHIMGQWAGYRVLKGDDYKYPIVGKLVARFIPIGSEGATKNLPTSKEDPSVAANAHSHRPDGLSGG